jgi:hypothetical protein
MTLFENTLTLRGFLGRDAEAPSSEAIAEDACAVLTLCIEIGEWWRPANEWISRTGWYRIICPGPYFCGFTRGMKKGEYIEVEGKLFISNYSSPEFKDPNYEVHAVNIRRLEIPLAGVIENYRE